MELIFLILYGMSAVANAILFVCIEDLEFEDGFLLMNLFPILNNLVTIILVYKYYIGSKE